MTQIGNLRRITQVQHDRAQQSYQVILQEEQRLRQELIRLSEMARKTAMCCEENVAMQLLGADVQWQAWIGRAKTMTNIQLAQVLARKEFQKSAVRKSFGQKTVLQTMECQIETNRKQKHAQKVLDDAIQADLNCSLRTQ